MAVDEEDSPFPTLFEGNNTGEGEGEHLEKAQSFRRGSWVTGLRMRFIATIQPYLIYINVRIWYQNFYVCM